MLGRPQKFLPGVAAQTRISSRANRMRVRVLAKFERTQALFERPLRTSRKDTRQSPIPNAGGLTEAVAQHLGKTLQPLGPADLSRQAKWHSRQENLRFQERAVQLRQRSAELPFALLASLAQYPKD